jgi:hypothetical protein
LDELRLCRKTIFGIGLSENADLVFEGCAVFGVTTPPKASERVFVVTGTARYSCGNVEA